MNVIQIVGKITPYNYRRKLLFKYLVSEKRLNVTQFSAFSPDRELLNILKKSYSDILIISFPYEFTDEQIKVIKEKNIKVIYERSDLWSKHSIVKFSFADFRCLGLADTISCSSKTIYDDAKMMTYNKEVLLLENGVSSSPIKEVEKHERPTAIYTYKDNPKNDFTLIKRLADANPSWDFLMFGNEVDEVIKDKNFILYPFSNDIETEIAKCHVGLIPFSTDNTYLDGMRPLKLMQYLKVGIPVFYTNCKEAEKTIGCYKIDKQNLNMDFLLNVDKSILEKEKEYVKDFYWEKTFEKIFEKILELSHQTYKPIGDKLMEEILNNENKIANQVLNYTKGLKNVYELK